jgi:Phage integrase, N-terminal SAM-like domain/Phage integrase family
MRELEASLQQFGEFLLKRRLVKPSAAPYCVRWVLLFLSRPAEAVPIRDRARGFCEEPERSGRFQDWEVQQAVEALRAYFGDFLKRTDWQRQPTSAVKQRHVDPLAALEELRRRIRSRHYSYRTECSYADWVRRFLAHVSEQQQMPHARVESDLVRDFLTHLAVRRRVSSSTQNQALCAVLFLCREVLGDVDFDQGLLVVRGGKGAKDRSTLLAQTGRDELRTQLRRAEATYRHDRNARLAGVRMPDALDRKYPNAGREFAWFWVFPTHTLSTDPRAAIVRRHDISDSVVQKAVKSAAVAAGIHKPVSVHTSGTALPLTSCSVASTSGRSRNTSAM